jgi:uncharacterized repeat protein (TIGR01451 family)/uncharacterized delta-60 repeat protein
MPLWMIAGLAGLALSVQAQIPPPNDNLTNAQSLVGVSGSVTGTNLNATAQTGEPSPFSTNAPGATIWYVWTAPFSDTMDFNTRGSTDASGNPLPTTLAVYRSTGTTNTPTFASLTKVAANVVDPNVDFSPASRVTFTPVPGTRYYFQVDGAAGTANEGTVVLNWGLAKVAGNLGFSTPVFAVGQFDDYLTLPFQVPGAPASIGPSLRNSTVQGDANARVTVVRRNGSTGRIGVTLVVTNFQYTNFAITNFVITNVFTTNYDTNFNLLGFTNTYYTNAPAIIQNQNDVQGFLTYQESFYDTVTAITNANGFFSGFTIPISLGTYNVTNYFTNFVCAPSLGQPSFSTNAGVITVSLTNIYCSVVAVTNYTDSAVPGQDYTPFTTNLTFDDFQMSQDVYVQVAPQAFFLTNGFFSIDTNGTFVPFLGGNNYGPGYPDSAGNYTYFGLNGRVALLLQNASLDPQEDQDITPPVISQPAGEMNILSYFGNTFNGFVGTNYLPGNYSVINWSRATYRVEKNVTNAVIFVFCTPPPAQTSYSVHWSFDSRNLGITVDDWNKFPTVADSEYAVPFSGDTNNWDFMTPTNIVDHGAAWTIGGVSGQIQFSPDDPIPGFHQLVIPINNNQLVEFDQDFFLQMYMTGADAKQDLLATPPAYLGNIFDANVTINFDRVNNSVQPGGAVDRVFNIDNDLLSQPPLNQKPGANQTVLAVGVQNDGNSVIGGEFTSYNSFNVNYLTRVLTNGQLDVSFNAGSGPNDFVSALAIDSLGRIVIGGAFTAVNGNQAYHIARLLPSGALDNSFNSGAGANGAVRTIAFDANNNILIGGDFTLYNTTNRNHIARLLPNGALDTAFNPGLGPDQSVLTVAPDQNGRIVIGGPFQTVGGSNYTGVARLQANGTLDNSLVTGAGVDGTVYSVVVQSNNEIWVAGNFVHYDLIQVGGIALLQSNGTLDTGFKPGTGANDAVYCMALQPDGKVVLGGQFTAINGTRRMGVARLLPSGWVDTSFMDTAYNQFAGLINHYYNTNAYNQNDVLAPYNSRNAAFAIALEPSGNVLIGGSFLQVGGGFTRDDRRYRWNYARLIGAPTSGLQLNGGLSNYPGNITLTQDPAGYSVNDTSPSLFITVVRTNGSLGRVAMTLGTNTPPPGPGSAGASDFSLVQSGTAAYNSVWDNYNVANNKFGWRETDGYYGPNNNTLTLSDRGQSALTLTINNNKSALQDLVASLSLIQITGTNNLTLGGVPIPFGPAIGVPTAPLKIINDNFPAGTLGYTITNYPVSESAGSVTITVTRTNGSTGPVSVNYQTHDGYTNGPTGSQPAIGGVDYVTTKGLLTFLAGQLTATFSVPIIDHSTAQSNKFFNVLLSGPTGGATLDTNVPPLITSNTVVNIIDDHFQPGHLTFSSSSYSVTKGGTAIVTVSRIGGALGSLSVEVGAYNGTGVNGINFVGTTNTLTWANGEVTNKTFTVQTLEDHTVEGPKTVNLFLFNPLVGANSPGAQTNAGVLAVPPTTAVLTVVDDDSPGTVNFAAPLQNGVPNFNVLQNSGQVLVTVVRTNGTVGPLTVNYATFNGTNAIPPTQSALSGTNYGGTNGTLTFGDGQTAATFAVPIYNYTNSGSALFNIVLFNPSPASTNYPKFGTVTILNTNLVSSPAGGVDTTLQTTLGFNDVVQSLSLQPDGKVLAGGNFTAVNGLPFGHIARLNADGSDDTTFLLNLAGSDNMVRVMLSQTPAAGQTNGAIMVGGDFANIDSVSRNRIARLNIDGSLDESFNPGAGPDNSVFSIVETFLPASVVGQPPVRYYYVGGAFVNYNGVTASGITRITSSGQLDPNFNTGPGVTGTNGTVYCVAVQANGQVVIGGDFTSFSNNVAHHLVRLNPDGSVDSSFTPDTGADLTGSVRALLIQPDGRILIGGLFTNVNGVNYNHIARLNADGTVDTSFNVGAGCDNLVLSLALDSQGRILVGGEFSHASGVSRNGITRLNPDGTVDPSINFGSGAAGYVQSIAIQGNDEFNVAGGFNSFNGIPEGNFVRLYGGAIAGPGLIEFSQPTFGVMENGTNATVTVQRIGGTADTSASIVFYTQDGSAISGIDYLGVTNTVTFPLGETFQTVTVPVLNSYAISTNKTVNLFLANPSAIGGSVPAFGPQPTAQLVITNSNSGVSFSAPSYRQSANAASGVAIIPVIRTGDPFNAVTVTVVTTTNGSAQQFINFVPVTNTIVFAPGQQYSTNTVIIPILNASNQLADVSLELDLTNASGGVIIPPSSTTLTIATANAGPGVLAFSQTNYVVSEGAGFADITIVRTNGTSGPVSVYLSTSNLTAQAGINYGAISNKVSFSDGQSSQDVFIPINQLTSAQPDSTVLLSLSNPTGGATIGVTNAVVLTIQNNIENFSLGSGSYFVSEGAGTVTIGILRNGPTNNTVTVGYTTYSPTNAYSTNGLAQPNVDYVPVSGTLTFNPGQTLQTIPIRILQGKVVNPSTSFQILLQNPSPGAQVGIPGAANITILGDIAGFSFVTNSYVVAENGSNVTVTVQRFDVNTGTVSVNFSTADGTALAGRDYVATNGTLVFGDGQGSTNFTIPILNPNVVESNLVFTVNLSNPSSNTFLLAPSNAVVTITNVLTGISFTSSRYSVSECGGQAIVSVVRTGVSNLASSVTFSTLPGGTAVSGQNYFPTNVTLNFATNQTQTNVVIQVIDDHIIEPNHTVSLALANVQNALLLNPNSALLTINECDGAFVVASGTALVSESISPANGIVDPGETVTVLLGLRCISGGSTANLVATLQPGAGVSNPSGAQTYGVLLEGGPTVSKPFTFTANATNGQNITATLTLQDGSRTLGTVAFGFTVGSASFSFTNSALIKINDSTNPPTAASPYPSIINVGGLAGNIEKVTVTFSNLAHTYPSDIAAVLLSPVGENSLLMSGAGGPHSIQGVTLKFDQSASVSLTSNQITSGTYLPTSVLQVLKLATASNSPIAAPLGPYQPNLNVFSGTPANGQWALFITDNKALDSGAISNGWILTLGTGNPVEEDADLTLTVNSSPSVPTLNNPVTFSVGITNYGPAGATNIVVTDVLPAGFTYVSDSCGCATATNGTLSFNLGTLQAGSGKAFSFVAVPDAVGLYTNTITATANQPDPNSNNVSVASLLISPDTADVGVSLAAAPNPVGIGGQITYSISVNNAGPSPAANVVTVDSLPAGFTAQSITASSGTFTNSNGAVIWTVPSLGASAGVSMTIVGNALLGGILTDSVNVTSDTYDPSKLNNFASAKTEVDVPSLSVVKTGGSYSLSWPASTGNFVLAGALSVTGPWTPITSPPPTLVNGQYVYQLPVGAYRFFRLQMQLP